MAKPNLSKALPAPEAVPDLAPFPIDVLPKGLRRYVLEAAVSIGCPPDSASKCQPIGPAAQSR